MTVFFTSSLRGQKTYHREQTAVFETLQSFKSIKVISPGWNSNYEPLRVAARKKGVQDSRLIEYQAIRQGIRLADAVVFEVSEESFQIGHETSFALSEKKPVLCLSLHEDFSDRLQNDYFFGARYTVAKLQPIIQDFLAKAREISLSRRFNLFLYPHQIEHLKLAGKRQGLNMSEYVRYLINLDKSRD